MTDPADSEPLHEAGLRERLEQEAGIISWPELARHFARGVVLTVAADINLIDAAERLAGDDAQQFRHWLENGDLARASDDDARRWTAQDASFACVVVAPWVLVQERPGTDG